MSLIDRFRKNKDHAPETEPTMSLSQANACLGEIEKELRLNGDTQTEIHQAKMQGRAEDRQTNGSMEFLTMQEQRLEKERDQLLAYIDKISSGLGHSALG